MRHPLPARTALAAGLCAAALVLSGCAADPAAPESPAPAATGVPQADVAGYAPLTVQLVAAGGEAPPGMTGREFGCGDLLVPVTTVPARPQDALVTALDFLTHDDGGEHGEPPLTNAVLEAAPRLVPTGHRREGDTEVVTFTGTIAPAAECQAQRVRAQLQETARAQTSAGRVRLEVDGQDLDALLGLPPLALGQARSGSAAPTTTAPVEPASSEPASTEPVSTEPASAEPVSTGSVSTEPASPEPASPSSTTLASVEPAPAAEPTDGPGAEPSGGSTTDEPTAEPTAATPSGQASAGATGAEPDPSGTARSTAPTGAASDSATRGARDAVSPSGSADANPSDG